MKKKEDNLLRGPIIRRVQQAVLDSGMTYHEIAREVGVRDNIISGYMGRDDR